MLKTGMALMASKVGMALLVEDSNTTAAAKWKVQLPSNPVMLS